MGVWVAAAQDAPLRLLGASSAATHGERDASRLLAHASLVVQQLTGLIAEPVLVDQGPDVIRTAKGAGLLVVGLPETWRTEGLGALRADLVKSAPVPMLLVRRGRRPGILGANEDVTRYRWSTIGHAVPGA
jgi:hypothetical protein